MCFFFFLPLSLSLSFFQFILPAGREGGVGERKQNGLWKVHMAGEKRIREREGEGNNRRFWRQSKWFREKISPHVKLGNISWGMPALNFLASNRTREYSRTLGVVSFFFKWTRERRGANSDPISRFNIPSSRRRFHRNRGERVLANFHFIYIALTRLQGTAITPR